LRTARIGVLIAGAFLAAACGGSSGETGAVAATTFEAEALGSPSTTAATPSASVIATTTDVSTTTSTTTTTQAPTTTSTVAAPTTTPHVVPVVDSAAAGWGTTHSGYPATDIFVSCGAGIVSPVNGVLLDVRTVDSWEPTVDNPATRGGRSIAVLGDDGVRYYMAHFDVIEPGLEPGTRVSVGQALGTMGDTGRSSACHLHFALSPPCPGPEWSVRRGVIWPYPYLDAWDRGEQSSPVDEIASWLAQNPDACTLAMADPNAQDS
jgi:murein DD-endopeptidase MepM/ murein hydrolase activator NlpD